MLIICEKWFEEPQLIDNCMKFNRLSLNCSKSAFLLYGLNQKNNFLENFSINIGGSNIPCVETVKYLGIVMAQILHGLTNHVHHVINKLAKAAGVSLKMRHHVDKKMMIQLYYYLVASLSSYHEKAIKALYELA